MPVPTALRLAAAAAGLALVVAAPAAGGAQKRGPAKCRVAAKALCAGAKLKGATLTGRNLAGVDLRRANLTRARLAKAKLGNAKLAGATLTGANLAGANLAGADLSRARLDGAVLAAANMTGVKLARATLRGADMRGVRFGKRPATTARTAADTLDDCRRISVCTGVLSADFTGADLRQAAFFNVTLTGATMTRTNLTGAIFTGGEALNVDFTSAVMKDVYIGDFDLRGAKLTGVDLRTVEFGSGTDLRGARLAGADLRGVDLSQVTLTSADLAGAKIDGAKLPTNVLESVPQTKVVGTDTFSAVLTSGETTVTCAPATECKATATYGSEWTLTVTSALPAFIICPDGPVRLAAAPPADGYSGSCTYQVFQGITIRVVPALAVTVRTTDGIGQPTTAPRVAIQWATPTGQFAGAEVVCIDTSVCVGRFPANATVRVVVTGTSPYSTSTASGCRGGTPVGGNVIVTDPPWQLTCLLDDAGNALPLTADREITIVNS